MLLREFERTLPDPPTRSYARCVATLRIEESRLRPILLDDLSPRRLCPVPSADFLDGCRACGRCACRGISVGGAFYGFRSPAFSAAVYEHWSHAHHAPRGVDASCSRSCARLQGARSTGARNRIFSATGRLADLLHRRHRHFYVEPARALDGRFSRTHGRSTFRQPGNALSVFIRSGHRTSAVIRRRSITLGKRFNQPLSFQLSRIGWLQYSGRLVSHADAQETGSCADSEPHPAPAKHKDDPASGNDPDRVPGSVPHLRDCLYRSAPRRDQRATSI